MKETVVIEIGRSKSRLLLPPQEFLNAVRRDDPRAWEEVFDTIEDAFHKLDTAFGTAGALDDQFQAEMQDIAQKIVRFIKAEHGDLTS